MERLQVADAAGAGLAARNGHGECAALHGRYEVVCRDPEGNEKWRDHVDNLITTVGKNDLWDKYLAGSSYTAAWYLGLVASSPSFSASDTMSSHSGWTESTAYSESTRPAPSWGAAAAGAKATTATAFSINGTATISGLFLASDSTKGGTTGILFSCGAFTGGDRSVASGDTLNATYTASA